MSLMTTKRKHAAKEGHWRAYAVKTAKASPSLLIPRRETTPGGRCAEPPLAIRGDPQVHTGKVPLNIVVEGGRPEPFIGIGLVIQHYQPLEFGCPEEAAVDIKG